MLRSLLGAPPNLEKLLQCKSSGNNLMHNSCVTSVLFPLVLLNLIIVLSIFRYHKLWRRTRRATSNNPSENSPLIESGNVRARSPERNAHFSFPFLISIGSVIALILIELSVIIIHALADSIWLSTVYTLYLLVTLLTWCACTTVLLLDFQFLGTTSESWIAHWFGGLVLPVELLMASRWLNTVTDNYSKDSWQVGLLSLYALRFASTGVFFYLSLREILKRDQRNTTSELEPESASEPASRPVESKSFYQQFMRVAPYMWSRDDVKLQLYVLAAFALLIIGRIIGPLTPYQYKIIVDSLSRVKPDPNSGLSYDLWTAVVTYGILRLLQGGNGFVSSIQAWVLIPINQFTTRKVSLDTFSHLHLLSLDFHIKRKTGEVLRVMDRGTSSIVQLMNYVIFSIFPTITDIVIAVFLLFYMFDRYYSMIVLVSMLFYMWITIAITEWRTKFRRAMNEHSNAVSAIAVDSLLNFETVKYFNAETFEVERYDEAMIKFLKADLQNSASLPILNLVQNFILTMAVLAGSLLCSYEVAHGTKTVGDFIYFNTYLLQLSVPLNFFGTLYRMIQQSFIDMEKMLDLLEVQQTVFDLPGASELSNRSGCEVTFDDVEFSYSDDSKTLNKLNFTVAPGKTYALVGPSGGGKSTILKLLFRFYDVKSGSIKIDGQDISKVTQSSLRRIIGVVPQDTVLFNDSIRYNIRYGNPSASDWEVEYAAKMAQIHERILSFPRGYDTVVGERGLRLSGGEKQRVAIARTFLKNPKIVLLDEATSALDTTTERQIQESFNLITEGRTTLVIAHRLSTVVSADCILCIQDGKIAEQGTHSELLEKGGLYASMWVKQLES